MDSVTRLCDFWKFLVTNLLTKKYPKYLETFGIFLKTFNLSKNGRGYFWAALRKYWTTIYFNIWLHCYWVSRSYSIFGALSWNKKVLYFWLLVLMGYFHWRPVARASDLYFELDIVLVQKVGDIVDKGHRKLKRPFLPRTQGRDIAAHPVAQWRSLTMKVLYNLICWYLTS